MGLQYGTEEVLEYVQPFQPFKKVEPKQLFIKVAQNLWYNFLLCKNNINNINYIIYESFIHSKRVIRHNISI